jgi:hypothetical protein
MKKRGCIQVPYYWRAISNRTFTRYLLGADTGMISQCLKRHDKNASANWLPRAEVRRPQTTKRDIGTIQCP